MGEVSSNTGRDYENAVRMALTESIRQRQSRVARGVWPRRKAEGGVTPQRAKHVKCSACGERGWKEAAS